MESDGVTGVLAIMRYAFELPDTNSLASVPTYTFFMKAMLGVSKLQDIDLRSTSKIKYALAHIISLL